MRGTTIAIIAAGVCELGIVGLKYAANRHARIRAAEKAISSRSEEVAEALKVAQERCDIFKKCEDREKKEFGLRLNDWKAANHFNDRKNDILNTIERELGEFKDQIGYSDRMDEINGAFDAEVEAFKTTIDYDGNKKKFEAAIADAKSHYESQKAMFEAAGDDISETAMKLKHASEEAMNAKVKEAKAQLEALEKQLTDETEKLTKKKLNDIRELEEKVSKERIRLDKKSNKDLESLNEELSKAQSDVRREITLERSGDEITASGQHENDIRMIREQKALDAKAADDIFNSTPLEVRYAEFLKEKKVPKAAVAVVGAIPMIPVGYLVYRYGAFVAGILKAM